MAEMFVLVFLLLCSNFSIWVEHPLILGSGLLGVSIVSLPLMISVGSLFGFSFFIVVVGGVLIVFAYSVSLISITKSDLLLKYFARGVGVIGKFWMVFLYLSMVFFLSSWVVGSGIFCWSDVLYFSKSWGLGVVLLGFLLLAIMVMAISLASKFKGALIK
uniref:NADH dehydrogenase subunit 6 n=1 Tax=Archivesica gigas TaxID=1298643 RepID=A0A2P1DMG7_9BIVA|nr:NADH dehydrogenase subunit 6 [Archivesica gigas]UFQ25390.1 NADH dehydrogenase subunit 6 [Archivesica gigas]UFQ25403.1 NADH dehydrogenase subunit 6 [Archivesica gigas]